MKLDEKVLLGAACFFAGAVAGFLIAPIKKGIYCGNNNGDSSEENENDEDVSVKSEEEAIDEINKVINEVAKEMRKEEK